MKIVVLGEGYIGSQFVRVCEDRSHDTYCLTRASADFTDYKDVRQLLVNLKPDFVINAAGYTGKPNVDACESDKDNTFFGNVIVPKTIGDVCSMLRIPWGHVSSGCIYSGDNGNGSGFSEDDEPNFSFTSPPCSFYSGTKAAAEKLLKQHDSMPYIWRLRIPFDEYDSPRNYLTKLMTYDKLLEANNSISHRYDFCDACVQLLEMKATPGIYNVCNPGFIKTSEVVKGLQDVLNLDRKFQFFKDESNFMKNVKTYRSNCVLNVTKLLDAGVKIRPVTEALNDALRNWKVKKQV